MYFIRFGPVTRESNPMHQPASEPKIPPTNPKPTNVPTENAAAVAYSICSAGSSFGTSS